MKPLTITPALLALLVAGAGCEDTPRQPLAPPALSTADAGDDEGTVAEADRTDGEDTSVKGIAGRLRSADRVLGVLGKRMDAISAPLLPPDPIIPPDPVLPDFRAVLSQIQLGAGYVRDVAAFLEVDVCDGAADRPAPTGAGDGTVADADRSDDKDTSVESLLGRLGSVDNVVDALEKRMDDIDSALHPPDPVIPPEACVSEVLDPLAAIQVDAQHVIDVAVEIERQLATLDG